MILNWHPLALTIGSVDDVTISGSLKKNEVSVLQSDLNTIERWSVNNNMKLNGKKCKEMIVSFVRSENDIPRLLIDGLPLDLVPSFIQNFGLNHAQ